MKTGKVGNRKSVREVMLESLACEELKNNLPVSVWRAEASSTKVLTHKKPSYIHFHIYIQMFKK